MCQFEGSNSSNLFFSQFSDIVLNAAQEPEAAERAREFEADEVMSHSIWYGLAVKILEPKVGICVLLATLCLCAPVCSYCFSVTTSIDFDMSVPSNAKTYDVFQSVEKEFGEFLWSFDLLLECSLSFNPFIFCLVGL